MHPGAGQKAGVQADRAPPWSAQTAPASCNLLSVPLYDALASTKPQVERSRILAALVSVTHMLSCSATHLSERRP